VNSDAVPKGVGYLRVPAKNAVLSTFAQPVSAPSKPKMLLAATPQGQLSSPIKVYQLISPFLARIGRILSIGSPLGLKSRRSLGTRSSRERSCGTQRIQLSGIPTQLTLEKPLNPGKLNAKTKSKKIVMSMKWNGLPIATYHVSILRSIGMMTKLVSMEKPPGSLSPTTSLG